MYTECTVPDSTVREGLIIMFKKLCFFRYSCGIGNFTITYALTKWTVDIDFYFVVDSEEILFLFKNQFTLFTKPIIKIIS